MMRASLGAGTTAHGRSVGKLAVLRRRALRDKLGRDVGSSLASAEHRELWRALTRRLACPSQDGQAEIMLDLCVEALKG